MSSTVQGPSNVQTSCLKDTTPPPTPTVTRAMAYDRAQDNAQEFGGEATVTGRRNIDPTYIELGNVEVGTTIQLVNLSKQPDAKFDGDAVVELKLTGRDVQNRAAAVSLTAEQMQAIDLQPGDMIQLRAVDQAGNPSGAVTVELQGTEWAVNRLRETINGSFVDSRGAGVAMLDGENTRKRIMAKAVNDARPPMVLEEKLRFAVNDQKQIDTAKTLKESLPQWKEVLGREGFSTADLPQLVKNEKLPANVRDAFKALADNPTMFKNLDQAGGHCGYDNIIGPVDLDAVLKAPQAFLQGDFAIEPGTQLIVQNQRTGERVPFTVPENRGLSVPLTNLSDGDPIIITPRDNNGNEGKTIDLVYSSRCKDGKAPKLKGGLGVQLGGVL